MLPLYSRPASRHPESNDRWQSIGTAIEERDLDGCRRVVKSNTDTPPWYHACTMMSRPGTGMIDPLCATQFSCSRLRRRHLVVAGKSQLAIDDVEDGVCAPGGGSSTAAGSRPAAPFVGEDHPRSVVVERRRVPIGEALVGDRIDPNRVHRVGDVERSPLPRARTGGKPSSGNTVMSWHCLVIARGLRVPDRGRRPSDDPRAHRSGSEKIARLIDDAGCFWAVATGPQ